MHADQAMTLGAGRELIERDLIARNWPENANVKLLTANVIRQAFRRCDRCDGGGDLYEKHCATETLARHTISSCALLTLQQQRGRSSF